MACRECNTISQKADLCKAKETDCVATSYATYRYDITSIACSRLILSLRHHAYKQNMAGKSTAQDAYTAKRSIISHVLSRVSPGGTHDHQEEKGPSGPFNVRPLQSHIALDTFQSSSRKLADEESLDDTPSTVPGIFVVTETKTAVDDRHH